MDSDGPPPINTMVAGDEQHFDIQYHMLCELSPLDLTQQW